MSRPGMPWAMLSLALCLLAAAPPALAQGRVDTGLKLRMADQLETTAPGPKHPAAAASLGSDRPDREDEPASFPLRGLTLQLTSGIRFEDNVFRTDINSRRDAVVVLQPKIFANGRLGRHDLRVGYEGNSARYQRVGSENHFNHRFVSSVDLDISRILKSSLSADLEFGTDPRGDLTSRPITVTGGERDRWRQHGVAGEITLGRRIARAQFGLAYGVQGIRYLNNAQQDRDVDERSLVLTGRYNLGPRFSLLGELGGAWIDYLSPTSDLDAREYIALAGVAWQATAKTRGEVKFGLRHRDFHSLSRSSLGGYTWDARVNWSPKSYSQVTAYTSRDVTESGFSGNSGTGTAVVDVYGLRWRYGLTDRITLDTGVQRSTAAFDGGGSDRFMKYDAGVRYKVNRWMDFFGEWSLDTRSATSSGFEAGTVFVGVDLRLDRPFRR